MCLKTGASTFFKNSHEIMSKAKALPSIIKARVEVSLTEDTDTEAEGEEAISPGESNTKEAAVVRQEMKQKKEVMKQLQKTGVPEERSLPRSQPFQVTSLDNSIKGDSLNWEQV